ncbi:MAG: VOC family protein [Pseudomonadota bacterium]
MIGYVILGTKDLKKAAAFYDALFIDGLGGSRFMEGDNHVAWMGPDPTKAGLGVMYPFDGEPASVGNGVMVALECDTPEAVDRMYKKAIDLGASDEGAAGPRGGGFYAGYFRDPDGNKLNFFCMTGDAG